MRSINKYFSILLPLLVMIFLCAGCFAVEEKNKSDKPKKAPDEIKMISYSQKEFDKAIKAKKPVIILFTADWCPPCKYMKENTFKDEEVIKLSKKFVFFKVDLTNVSKETNKIADSYKIEGIPTVLLYGKDGKKSKESFAGAIDGKEFISRMKKVLNPDKEKEKKAK